MTIIVKSAGCKKATKKPVRRKVVVGARRNTGLLIPVKLPISGWNGVGRCKHEVESATEKSRHVYGMTEKVPKDMFYDSDFEDEIEAEVERPKEKWIFADSDSEDEEDDVRTEENRPVNI